MNILWLVAIYKYHFSTGTELQNSRIPLILFFVSMVGFHVSHLLKHGLYLYLVLSWLYFFVCLGSLLADNYLHQFYIQIFVVLTAFPIGMSFCFTTQFHNQLSVLLRSDYLIIY